MGGGVARGRGVVNRGELLLLHWGLVLRLVWVVVARVTGVAPAPLATGGRATLPAGGAVVVWVGGRLGLGLGARLWQQRWRISLGLVARLVGLLQLLPLHLHLHGQVLRPAQLQGLQGRRGRQGLGERVWNVGVAVGIVSPGDGGLVHTLRGAFGAHAAGAVRGVAGPRPAVLHLAHQLGVQGEVVLPPAAAAAVAAAAAAAGVR